MRETSSLCRESGLPVAAEFTDALEGLEYLQSHSVDLALISWCMTGIDGPMLGKLVKKLVPQTRVIYLSDEAVEAEEVYETEAFGYLRRPADTKKLRHYVSLAERASRRSSPSASNPEPPVIERRETEREVVIRTFGHFDVYVDSKPLFFPNRRAKEMLAMLVDCQGAVMTREHFFGALLAGFAGDGAAQVHLPQGVLRAPADPRAQRRELYPVLQPPPEGAEHRRGLVRLL